MCLFLVCLFTILEYINKKIKKITFCDENSAEEGHLFFCWTERTRISTSETKPEEGESAINQALDGNGLEMSRKKMTLFTDKCSISITNIVENEEHKRVSLLAAPLNIANETTGKFFKYNKKMIYLFCHKMSCYWKWLFIYIFWIHIRRKNKIFNLKW